MFKIRLGLQTKEMFIESWSKEFPDTAGAYNCYKETYNNTENYLKGNNAVLLEENGELIASHCVTMYKRKYKGYVVVHKDGKEEELEFAEMFRFDPHYNVAYTNKKVRGNYKVVDIKSGLEVVNGTNKREMLEDFYKIISAYLKNTGEDNEYYKKLCNIFEENKKKLAK